MCIRLPQTFIINVSASERLENVKNIFYSYNNNFPFMFHLNFNHMIINMLSTTRIN